METLYPGLYLVEQQGEAPIEGVSNSVAGFVGVTERGPLGKSGLVTSWNDFLTQYGGYINESFLAYAVRGFFENGGKQAYISRVVHYNEGIKTSLASTVTLKDSTSVTTFVVDAKYDGVYGNKLAVEVSDYVPATKQFTFKVYEKGVMIEKYTLVTLATLEEIVNPQSKLISVTVFNDTLVPQNEKKDLSGGVDGLVGLISSDYIGSPVNKNGLYAFDNDPINLLAVPGNTDATVISSFVGYAEARQDCFVVTEIPMGKTPQEAKDYLNTNPALVSERLALYFGWLKVNDPIGIGKNPTKFVPNSGHVIGAIARTDSERGVWKAPAGLDAKINGAIGVDYNVNDVEQGTLNPEGVNVIRAFPGTGLVIWGTRTTKEGEFTYIPVRRSVDYVEQSILGGTRWAVFEPNDSELYDKLRTSIEDFLRGYWNAGGLKGATEQEAFFVQCDSTTTSQEEADAGKVFANIGLATRKPAEFIIFRVSLRN